MSTSQMTHVLEMEQPDSRAILRALVIGVIAFLTVVDLFATQAILPALTHAYRTSPAVMSFAVNASTIGMAIAGLAMAVVGRRINRRLGILLSLILLAIPTLLLSTMPSIPVFTGLRILQGLCMATAFTLTLAYVAETSSQNEAVFAVAAYITGNVASNLLGRLLSAAVADHFGLAWNFSVFAALNISGALLVFVALGRKAAAKPTDGMAMMGAFSAWLDNMRDPSLRAAFTLGFCILFAFIGTFTYVNFLLVRQPFELGMMGLGFVYFVFLPSMVTTPLAGPIARKYGARLTGAAAMILAALGLPLLLLPTLSAVLLGLVLVSVGTFYAQAVATGFVGRAARADRAAASGMYLASYFLGGLVGSAMLGQVFDRLGWTACVVGIGLALFIGIAMTCRLVIAESRS
jgi:MFS transporter, YNFM family, putative membrane transport protein